ncbi:MAG: glycosyltransferase family 4 protein [Pirellulaceae bacterium]|nr:glycosyltransferase family 4 protein [Pirellulaceae bacterium]
MSSQFRSSARHLERTSTQLNDQPSLSCARPAARTPDELRSLGANPRRVFIDATYTLGSGRRSGIERVVNNLRENCGAMALDAGAQYSTLLSQAGQFYGIGPQQQAELQRLVAAQADVVSSLPSLYRRCVSPLVQVTGSKKLKTWLLPQAGHLGMFKLPYRYWYRHMLRSMCASAPVVEPGEGDLLILPDAYWARKEVWDAVIQARARGAYTAVVVYDLIPLSHPEFVGDRRKNRFAEYLRQVASHSDLILTISQTVRRELEAKLPELMQGAPYCRNIRDFPLGAEFPATQSAPQVRPEVQQLFGHGQANNPYLTVAAFDPRKNHRYLLDAFDSLWQSLEQQTQTLTQHDGACQVGPMLPKLCLVGRVGGRCEDVMQRIHQHPRLGKQLFTFHDLTDIDLQYCYHHCRGVIFPSIVEGFGLPIVESLWHGARTLASDTAIHREVGGESCQYFDLAHPGSLVELLLQLEHDSTSAGTGVVPVRPYSWSESAGIFFNQCLESYRLHSAPALARSAYAAGYQGWISAAGR